MEIMLFPMPSHQSFYLQRCTIIHANQIQLFAMVLTGGPRKRKREKKEI